MHTIYLALGANVGDKQAHIEKAIELLREKISDIRVANMYETKPVGVTNQDNFLNTAIVGNTKLSVKELLHFVKDVEKHVGRVARFRWGPREIDIDILFYDDMIYRDDQLDIPHIHLHERDFVLRPLLDLDPHFMHPVIKRSIQQLYDVLPRDSLSVISPNKNR